LYNKTLASAEGQNKQKRGDFTHLVCERIANSAKKNQRKERAIGEG